MHSLVSDARPHGGESERDEKTVSTPETKLGLINNKPDTHKDTGIVQRRSDRAITAECIDDDDECGMRAFLL